MPVNDAPHIGEPDTGALKLGLRMQALEHTEQLIRILHVEPHAVVANAAHGLAVTAGAGDIDRGHRAWMSVFHGVPEQIHEHQAQHAGIGPDLGQGLDVPDDLSIPRLFLQVLDHLLWKGSPG